MTLTEAQIEQWARDGSPADGMHAHEFRRRVADLALSALRAQEPVAWMVSENGGKPIVVMSRPTDEECAEHLLAVTPLFARPQAAREEHQSVSPGTETAEYEAAAQPAQNAESGIPQFISDVMRLVVAGRTTGGVAGRDETLCAALDAVEAHLVSFQGAKL